MVVRESADGDQKTSERVVVLPLFIHRDNKALMGVLCAFAFFIAYSIPNHYHLFPPQLLPLTEFDRAVPFMPWTIFIYSSEYLLFILAYIQFESEVNRNRYVWSYMGVLLIGAFFFVFFLTTYPRNDFPLPVGLDPLTYKIFAALRVADDPSNCFPSMHVTCCLLTALSFWSQDEKRWKFWFYFIWAALISASTLPTKQHYVVDIIGGIMVASFGYWFFFKRVKYIPLSEYIDRLRNASREMIEDWAKD